MSSGWTKIATGKEEIIAKLTIPRIVKAFRNRLVSAKTNIGARTTHSNGKLFGVHDKSTIYGTVYSNKIDGRESIFMIIEKKKIIL